VKQKPVTKTHQKMLTEIHTRAAPGTARTLLLNGLFNFISYLDFTVRISLHESKHTIKGEKFIALAWNKNTSPTTVLMAKTFSFLGCSGTVCDSAPRITAK